MILIDTSGWTEFLRDSRSPVCEEVDRLLVGDAATCEVIRMEIRRGPGRRCICVGLPGARGTLLWKPDGLVVGRAHRQDRRSSAEPSELPLEAHVLIVGGAAGHGTGSRSLCGP